MLCSCIISLITLPRPYCLLFDFSFVTALMATVLFVYTVTLAFLAIDSAIAIAVSSAFRADAFPCSLNACVPKFDCVVGLRILKAVVYQPCPTPPSVVTSMSFHAVMFWHRLSSLFLVLV